MLHMPDNFSAYRPGRICWTAILFIFALVLSAQAETLQMKYSFERPEMRPVTISGVEYQRLSMPDAPNGGQPGEPALPGFGARILVPYGMEVQGIEIVPGEKVLLGDNIMVEPVAAPFPLSADADQIKPAVPDSNIYQSANPFPSQKFRSMGTQTFRGYQVLVLKLRPVEYIPKSGRLSYFRDLTVSVTLGPAQNNQASFRGLAEDEAEIYGMIDNPDAAMSYRGAAGRGAKGFDMMILTLPEFASAFQPLKDYHDTTGLPTQIFTIADVGSSDCHAIRDFIRAKYLNDGIDYVLIGADDEFIPALDLYVIGWEGSTYVEFDMPGDIYYACLDGTYNYDGDAYWAEPTDGEGGGDVDLLAEVHVGRVSAGSISEVNQFINKTFQYLTTPSGYRNKVLLAGEQLTFGGLGEYGGYSLDEFIDGSSNNGYATIGFPATMFEIERLYDRDYPGNDWPSFAIADQINAGSHVINHYGHCNRTYAMKMNYTDLISLLSNTDLCFIYSQGCLAGHFDQLDCWAEYVTIKYSIGAFAAIMNARYGWGNSDTDGPSQRYDREFFDAIFNPIENKPQLGRANQDSREDNLYRIDEPAMRWCYYELHLFGDPAMQLRIDPGLLISCPNGVPQNPLPGVPATFEVDVSGICGGIPVSGSGFLHYSRNHGDNLSTAMNEFAPGRYLAELPILNCGDTLEFYVSIDEAGLGPVIYPENPAIWQAIPVAEYLTIF